MSVRVTPHAFPFLPRFFHFILGMTLRFVLSLRYRVQVEGLKEVQARNDGRPILFLPNHPALMDPPLLCSCLWGFRPRPLGDENQVDRPLVRQLAALTRPVIVPDLRKKGREVRDAVLMAMQRCAEALKAGDNLLIYPAGSLSRDGREYLGGNRGVHWLLEQVPQCRVVLVRTRGLWGSSFSHALRHPDTLRGLARAALRLAGNLIFLMPRRKVHIYFEEATSLPRTGGIPALNRHIEEWLNREPEAGSLVPYYFWQGSCPQQLPPRTAAARQRDTAVVDEALRARVLALVAEQAIVSVRAEDLQGKMSLGGDLGIDSLSLAELSLKLEEVAGHSVQSLGALLTVDDCVLAAAGQLEEADGGAPAPAQWAAQGESALLDLPEAPDMVRVILRQARRHPERLVQADAEGAADWRTVLLRALALGLFLQRHCAGQERVGVMLPASRAASLTWLALLLAGKTPVMLNWTTGAANFRHCIELSAVRTVLTSRRLLERLEGQGFDAGAATAAGADWFCLEDVAQGMGLRLRLEALIRSRLVLWGQEWAGLLAQTPETAVLLFTSGSEAAPKGVPLSHANIMSNCRDITRMLSLTNHDCMLGKLPPFHSLGLTGNVALPLCFGMPIVYHPNPTEGARLNMLCRRWRVTMLVGPPSFLDGMLQQANAGELRSVRLGFVGAEACPQRVYDAFISKTSGVLFEGYGITECSPGVCCNRPEASVPGTIGYPIPSVEVALVSLGEPLRRVAVGERGIILVRGDNVFSGYLAGRGHTPPDPFVYFEGRRWFRSGDLATADATGRLTFAGRLGRFVKLGGEMISLPQMERILLEYVAGRPDLTMPNEGPALAVESLGTDGNVQIVLCTAVDISREEANAALKAAGLSALYAVRRVIPMQSLPVLGTGKTDYRSLRLMISHSLEQG
ncbi:MAG: AMP-binding protein [Desulfovibrio sp.]|nr:AMP-binding protein [Desulfovibrio sp.]